MYFTEVSTYQISTVLHDSRGRKMNSNLEQAIQQAMVELDRQTQAGRSGPTDHTAGRDNPGVPGTGSGGLERLDKPGVGGSVVSEEAGRTTEAKKVGDLGQGQRAGKVKVTK